MAVMAKGGVGARAATVVRGGGQFRNQTKCGSGGWWRAGAARLRSAGPTRSHRRDGRTTGRWATSAGWRRREEGVGVGEVI